MAFPEYVSDTSIYTFTTPEEMALELSTQGLTLHTDDLIPTNELVDPNNAAGVNDTNYLLQLCQRATSHIMGKLGVRYDAINLYKIPRIREIATYWALYKLTGRRGNPRLYEGDYVEALDTLQAYVDGTEYLAAPVRGQRAVLQSGVVDNRFTLRPYRVIREASTDVKPGQPVTWRPFIWL